jgi:hypothetical protein
MPETDAQRIEIANQTRTRFGQDQVLTPLQARAFVRAIQTTWQVETIQWSDANSLEVLAQAQKLVHAGGVLLSVEGGSASEAGLAFRRAGELFEWLARSDDEMKTSVPLALFAAGSYQLGGLPAMASGILRQITSSDDGMRLFANFLSADFDRVLSRAAAFWQVHPELTVRNAGENFFIENSEGDLAWLATVELVRCIGLAACSLRRGDQQRFAAALTHLRKVERFLVRLASEDVALIAFFMRAACERYGKATIYEPLRQLAALRPDRTNYMNGFARRQYARGRGILWQSQHQGLDRLLQNSSFALCTPTGSGKTLVANLAIVKELLLLADGLLAPLALYLVPSRALAGEVEAKLATELGRDFIVTGLYGGADWGITDAWLTSDMPTVLIATVEKADALMRYLGPSLLARLRLLIVDEAHQVVVEDSVYEQENLAEHSSRAARLEGFISRLLARQPDIVRIALTAVAGGAAHPVARWIESDTDAVPIGTYYRSTRQAVGTFEVRPNNRPEILLDMLNDRLLAVRGRAANVYINLRIDPMPKPPAGVRGSINRYTQISILWAALHLIDSDRRILVSISQNPEDTIKWYAEAFGLKGWDILPQFVPPQEGVDAQLFSEARMVCVDYCGGEAHELALLDRGIATNHGQMPQKLRRMMVALIERSICRITVATATLTEGVNLPFDLIFVPSVKRTSFDVASGRQSEHPMSTAEFRNLSGRAGRPGAAKGMEGMTLVALPITPSATASGQRPTQRRQIAARRSEYDDLIGRLTADTAGGGEHYSPLSVLLKSIRTRALQLGVTGATEFLEWLESAAPADISDQVGNADASAEARLADSVDELDGVILSAIEELQKIELAQMTPAQIEAAMTAVWQNTFARVATAYENWMEQAFVQRGKGLVENIYPDAAERRRLYSYGYTPCVGRRFGDAAERLLDILHYADSYGGMSENDRLALFVQLGEIVARDKGFGFFIRDTVVGRDLYARWHEVLAWWMAYVDAPVPPADHLRAWQTFVADNLDFRLGVAIGAVVAQRWTEENADPFATPTLDTWKAVSDLPWFAFWAKELLRWGTLEPFVAFALSQGIARSRDDAANLKPRFIEWLEQQPDVVVEGEELIDPRNFLKWSRSQTPAVAAQTAVRRVQANLSGTDGNAGRYAVIPLRVNDGLRWIDPAGYELAVSEEQQDMLGSEVYAQDFDLTATSGHPAVTRVF